MDKEILALQKSLASAKVLSQIPKVFGPMGRLAGSRAWATARPGATVANSRPCLEALSGPHGHRRQGSHRDRHRSKRMKEIPISANAAGQRGACGCQKQQRVGLDQRAPGQASDECRGRCHYQQDRANGLGPDRPRPRLLRPGDRPRRRRRDANPNLNCPNDRLNAERVNKEVNEVMDKRSDVGRQSRNVPRTSLVRNPSRRWAPTSRIAIKASSRSRADCIYRPYKTTVDPLILNFRNFSCHKAGVHIRNADTAASVASGPAPRQSDGRGHRRSLDGSSMPPSKQGNVPGICLPAKPVPAAGWAVICSACETGATRALCGTSRGRLWNWPAHALRGRTFEQESLLNPRRSGPGFRRSAIQRNKSPATRSLACAHLACQARSDWQHQQHQQAPTAPTQHQQHQRINRSTINRSTSRSGRSKNLMVCPQSSARTPIATHHSNEAKRPRGRKSHAASARTRP